jgi:hypothetical protein
MAIDYIINYDCEPRRALGSEEILELLKERERADLIIRMYRDAGDMRPPSEMGFDFTRTTPEGEEETRLIIVQDLLDRTSALQKHAPSCANCPANRLRKPYGCAGFIEYPISGEGEAWLLNQLPTPDDALVWLLLKQGVDNFAYDGQDIAALRAQSTTYFQDRKAPSRRLGEFEFNGNQAFDMLFNVGDIAPNHAAMMLLFFGGIRRDLQADAIMRITPAPRNVAVLMPFLHKPSPDDDRTIDQLKGFFNALYVAWALGVTLQVFP